MSDRALESVFTSLAENMRQATDSFNLMARHFRGAKREDVESWPVYADKYGGIMCGQDSCPCDMEDAIVLTPYEEGRDEWPRFNLDDLYDAIEAHIVWAQEWREKHG